MVSIRCRYAVLVDGQLADEVDVCRGRRRVERVYTSLSTQLTVYIITSSNDTTSHNFLLQYQCKSCDVTCYEVQMVVMDDDDQSIYELQQLDTSPVHDS